MGSFPRLVRAPRATAVFASGAALFALASVTLAGESPSRAGGTVREDSLRELGRRLFFDPAASRMGMRSCADCHDPGHGYSDPEKVSRDDAKTTKRHSQTIVDTADSPTGHWDGEFQRIEEVVRSRLHLVISQTGETTYGSGDGQVIVRTRRGSFGGGRAIAQAEGPPTDPGITAANLAAQTLPAADEGLPAFVGIDVLPKAPRAAEVFSIPAGKDPALLDGFVNPRGADQRPGVASNLKTSRRYDEAFRTVFGDAEPSIDRIARAVERYCHSVRSGESPYDRFAAGKDDAISASAKRGHALFQGAAGCATCHSMEGPRAKFTDYGFHDTGISWKALEPAARRGNGGDLGALQRGGGQERMRAFKTPTLRDVARRGPYMHDGSLATLADVVRHYVGAQNAGGSQSGGAATAKDAGPGGKDPGLDANFPSYAASETDVADLVAFLETLTSDRRPGLAATAWGKRVSATRLEFLDAGGRPLADFPVALVPAGDVLPGFVQAEAEPRRMRTGADGTVTFAPLHSTHVRVLLGEGFQPAGGDLVPDTCAKSVIVVPVLGKAALLIGFPKGETAPETIVVTHPEAPLLPDRRAPVSILRRKHIETDRDGLVQGTYETPFRTDVGPVIEFTPEKPKWGQKSLRLFLDPEVPSVLQLK